MIWLLLFTVLAQNFTGIDDKKNTYLYDLLNVSKEATKAQIVKAFVAKAKIFHPDKGGDEEMFKRVNFARTTLTDEEKRVVYDKYGLNGLKQNSPSTDDFFNPFEMFFGFGRKHRYNGESELPKKPDIIIPLYCTLDELYSGAIMNLLIKTQTTCPKCSGTGAENGKSGVTVCQKCSGTGLKVIKQMIAPGQFMFTQSTCPHCNGKGKIIKQKCPRCNGHKVTAVESRISVNIDPGTREGHTIRIPEKGDSSPDHRPGDLILKIFTTPSAKLQFRRLGDNLYTRHTISLTLALKGFKITLPHFEEKTFEIVRKNVTQPGQVIVVKDKGMPKTQDEGEGGFGDLFVEFIVVLPLDGVFANKTF